MYNIVITSTDAAKLAQIYAQQIANYAQKYFNVERAGEVKYLQMYVKDVTYNLNVLNAFIANSNVQTLHTLRESIILQDTIVREYFIKTFNYIEHCAKQALVV